MHAVIAAIAGFTLAASALAEPPVVPAATTDAAPAVAVRIVPATAVPRAPEPLICRSSVETGSLVKRHKQSLTKAQWRYVNDQHESFARKIVDDSMGRPFCDDKC